MRKSDLIKALPETSQKVPLASLRAFLPFARPYRMQILAAIGALLMVSGAMLSMGRGWPIWWMRGWAETTRCCWPRR